MTEKKPDFIDVTLGKIPQKEKGALSPVECKTTDELDRFWSSAQA